MPEVEGRVLVVDDDPSVRVAITRLLRAAGFDVASYDSASAFLARPPEDRPTCVVLDQRLPGLTGLELQKAIAGDSTIAIVFISGHADVPLTVEAMKAGAVDVLQKPLDEAQLVAAVSTALTRSVAVQAHQHEHSTFLNRLATLTPRERQVGTLVVQGLLNKQIAWELGTAEKTVKVHRARVMEKLAVGSVAELARLAERTRTLRASED